MDQNKGVFRMDKNVVRCIGCFIAMFAFELFAAYLGTESPGYYVLMALSLVMLVLFVVLLIHARKDSRKKGEKEFD